MKNIISVFALLYLASFCLATSYCTKKDLTLGIKKHDFECIDAAIEDGAPINGYANDLKRPLQVATEAAAYRYKDLGNGFSFQARLSEKEVNTDVLEHLMDVWGASVHFTGFNNLTPLFNAVEVGSPKLIQFLVERWADVDARDNWGLTPLHYAARLGDKSVIEALLKAGATIEATDRDGYTPLHMAAAYGCWQGTWALLWAGASLTARTLEGKTPADVAKDAGHWDLAFVVLAVRALSVGPLDSGH